MYLTWLDSNTWLIEVGGQRVLLDPWLVGPLVFNNLNWLFKAERRTPRAIPENLDLILLSQGLEDHAHPPTLKQLDRDIPVVGSVGAAKVVRELGYKHVTALAQGETFTLNNRVEILATPGSPVGPTTIENGYLLKELESGLRLYYEPHGFHPELLKKIGTVDVAIVPIVDIAVPFLGPVIKGMQGALELAQWTKPQVIVPTATGGDLVYEGLLVKLLKEAGSIESFRSLLAQHHVSAEVPELPPGERFELKLQERELNAA